eukprot:7330660-Alexandrium_andersonii.AAC.1
MLLGRRAATRSLGPGVTLGNGGAVALAPQAVPWAGVSLWSLLCRLPIPSTSRFLGAFGAGAAMACM